MYVLVYISYCELTIRIIASVDKYASRALAFRWHLGVYEYMYAA
jgi:hypothetical protein